MAQRITIENEIAYYYDTHSTKEDVMGESSSHSELLDYLNQVLRWLFWGKVCAIYKDLNFYRTSRYKETPLVPDLAVIKGVKSRKTTSWTVGIHGPAPHVVFEIASKETWKKDLEKKPHKYARMGVQEYFLYDPHEPPLSQETAQRLWGWQLHHHEMHEMLFDQKRRLWSSQLESYLVADGDLLRLYDRDEQLRLTRAEAADKRAEMEAQARMAADRRAEEEARRADAEAVAMQALLEKLRSRGIDPDQL